MSTYINVTVGKTGLGDKAKQQTNANRQAKLEADARNKAEVDGKRQRDANRALQGIGPDGKPLFGQPLQRTARKDEPAAARQGLPAILAVPSSPFTATGIPARFRGIRSSEIPFSFYLAPAYESSAGPNGSSAMASAGSTDGEDYGGFYEGDIIKIPNKTWTVESYMRLGSPATGTRIKFGNQTIDLGWTNAYGQVYAMWTINGAEPSQGELGTGYFRKSIYPVVAVGDWVHAAIVQTAAGYAGFFNGQRIFTADPVLNPGTPFYGETNKTEYGCRAVIQIIDRKSINLIPEAPTKPAVHGYRFTAGKALYSGATYAPPVQITSFA